MSSPVHNDGDRKLMYAPPWIRDQQRQDDPKGANEEDSAVEPHFAHEPERHVSHSVIDLQQSGTERRLEAPGLQTNEQRLHPDENDKFGSDETYEETYEDEPYRASLSPSRLDPTVMPPPPVHSVGVLNLGMGVRWIGAVAVAAIVAMVVTIATQAPPDDGLAVLENAGAAVRQSLASVQVDVSNAAAVQPSQATQVPPAITQPDRPITPQPVISQNSSTTIEPPREALQESRRLSLLEPATTTPPALTSPPAPVSPRSPTANSLTREEMTSMLRRGQDMISAGDIAGARLILFRVSEAGDAEASLTLARTFDADVLAKLNVVGAVPDATKARALYAKAAGQGSREAKRRLEEWSR